MKLNFSSISYKLPVHWLVNLFTEIFWEFFLSHERINILMGGIDTCVINYLQQKLLVPYWYHAGLTIAVLIRGLLTANICISFLWSFLWWMEPTEPQIWPAGPASSSQQTPSTFPPTASTSYWWELVSISSLWGVECNSEAPTMCHWDLVLVT